MRIKHLILLSGLALLALFSACDGDSGYGKENSFSSGSRQYMKIVQNHECGYALVSSGTLSSDADAFAGAFKSISGAELRRCSTPGTYAREILVGTGKDCEEAVAGLRHGYVVKAMKEKIIVAGTSDAWTVLALEAFTREVIARYATADSLSVPAGFMLKEDIENPQLIANFITTGRQFSTRIQRVGAFPPDGNLVYVQGIATDGTNVFYVIRNGADDRARVYKYQINPFGFVARSEEFNGSHCNDMTFDAKNRRAIVIHGGTDPYGVTAVDASTMALTSIRSDVPIGGIAYNSNLNQYGITRGGLVYCILDEDFRKVNDFGRTDGMGDTYLVQGMGCDDFFVYFPMSPLSTNSGTTTDNVLVVYDWQGQYKCDIHIPTDMESESMIYAGGEYYVNFNTRKEAALYRIEPVIYFTYNK